MSAVKLVSIDTVQPSTYNPRITDPARLALVKLSLQKLGFLLPIYADGQGEILSGHQRHLAATDLGWDHIPVAYTKPFDLEQRRNLNIVFNRATNDLKRSDTSETITESFDLETITRLGEALPDKKGVARFPCLDAQTLPLEDFIPTNAGRWNDYARNLAGTLGARGIHMPVVARRDLRVINGIGRIQHLSEKGIKQVEVVFIDDAEADFAAAMLNYLSMDFNIHERYADTLRHNSFRRSRGDRMGRKLGMGMLLPLDLGGKDFDLTNPANVTVYTAKYGQKILDFGAGRLEDVTWLREQGLAADAFEPYTLSPGTESINPTLARQLTAEFLESVASGKQWDTIFLQAVLNSVPFAEDRQHVIRLLAALSGPFTTVYAYTSSRHKSSYTGVKGQDFLHRQQNRAISFELPYEDGVVLGDYAAKPKMQKYFHEREFVNLFRREFRAVVHSQRKGGVIWCAVREPRGVDKTQLRQAIAFEFDLPYPDGSRLGLVDEARAAFGQRLGVSL